MAIVTAEEVADGNVVGALGVEDTGAVLNGTRWDREYCAEEVVGEGDRAGHVVVAVADRMHPVAADQAHGDQPLVAYIAAVEVAVGGSGAIGTEVEDMQLSVAEACPGAQADTGEEA